MRESFRSDEDAISKEHWFGPKGGRGGDVYHLTTLRDSGPGSLRESIDSMKEPRTIAFDIGGLIRLKDELRINKKISNNCRSSSISGIMLLQGN
jgi:hypothetical protein